ncbi:P1 family peptidase [Arthrobacter crystallopoietes]|uniref:P1 family peptidase n=1 Tax=Crystallibacter crystallopoietes TaxID=37928 RepID=UPI001ABECC3B|nr:P1 family peptidase [Arthrobacter crystallopoietes]QTG80830.1 P1 family peptidase [Arthrobacter crystallopoietes]
MTSSITDVPGIKVGQVQRIGGGWLSGVTVVLPPPGTIGSVHVGGGGPATHETDALDPTTLVPTVDAVVLTGGSAFGLITAHGAQRWLEEQDRGFRTDAGVVPIVPAAAIFDLGRGGDAKARPTEQMGYDAAAAAGASPYFAPVQRGNAGAGTGAALDYQRYKGGVGSASLRMSGGNSDVVIGAIAVVNAAGAPVGLGTEQVSRSAPALPPLPTQASPPSQAPLNTTLCVIATNAVLDPAQVKRTASASHAGLARALNPSHTLGDGDVVFGLATGEKQLVQEGPVTPVLELQILAAEAVRLAILDAVASAETVETPAVVLAKHPDLT